MQARCISGEVKTLPLNAAASTAIAVGDFLFTNGTAVLPMGTTDWGSSTYGNKLTAAIANFVGVSADQRLASNATAGLILGYSTGRYVVAVSDEDVKDVGTYYTFANASTNTLSAALVSNATPDNCFARLARIKPANATFAEVEVFGMVAQLRTT